MMKRKSIVILAIFFALAFGASYYVNGKQTSAIRSLGKSLTDTQILYNGAMSEFGVRVSNIEQKEEERELTADRFKLKSVSGKPSGG